MSNKIRFASEQYVEDKIKDINISEIDEIFGGTIPSILYSLGENSISSNMSESIYNGDSYITTIDAINGYKITNVQVLMDNIDITSNVYSGNIINIPVVNGNVEIIVSTRPPEIYTITYNLTNCSSSNTETTITEGDSYTSSISCVSPYILQQCNVDMEGEGEVTKNQTGSKNCNINIPEVTGNIIITAMADN